MRRTICWSVRAPIQPHTCKAQCLRCRLPAPTACPLQAAHSAGHQPAWADLRGKGTTSTVCLTGQTSLGDTGKRPEVVTKLRSVGLDAVLQRQSCVPGGHSARQTAQELELLCEAQHDPEAARGGQRCERVCRRLNSRNLRQRQEPSSTVLLPEAPGDVTLLQRQVPCFSYAQPRNEPRLFSHQMLWRRCFTCFIYGKH